MEEVITKVELGEEIMTNEPLFPLLEELRLQSLPKLGISFSLSVLLSLHLREEWINDCPDIKIFIQQRVSVSTPSLESVNDDEVSCPSQEELRSWTAHNITALYSHQLPTAYFSKLEKLDV